MLQCSAAHCHVHSHVPPDSTTQHADCASHLLTLAPVHSPWSRIIHTHLPVCLPVLSAMLYCLPVLSVLTSSVHLASMTTPLASSCTPGPPCCTRADPPCCFHAAVNQPPSMQNGSSGAPVGPGALQVWVRVPLLYIPPTPPSLLHQCSVPQPPRQALPPAKENTCQGPFNGDPWG
jgi:hypothetical protein